MKLFPDQHSVLIMDNCWIHHTDALQDVLNDRQCSFVELIYSYSLFDRDHATVSTTILTGPESYRGIFQHLYLATLGSQPLIVYRVVILTISHKDCIPRKQWILPTHPNFENSKGKGETLWMCSQSAIRVKSLKQNRL